MGIARTLSTTFSAVLLISIWILGLLEGCTRQEEPGSFSFVAVGDTAYVVPQDYPAFDALIEAINQARPRFSIHIGDTKGPGSCDDDRQQSILGFFQKFEQPLIYTPGDNEWADCWLPQFGAEDPLERLAAVRRIFFSNAESLGQNPLTLERQSDVSDHEQMVENARWAVGNVLFATLHEVGAANSERAQDVAAVAEFRNRRQANLEWIENTFAVAVEEGFSGIVFALHAEIFEPPFLDPAAGIEAFGSVVNAFREGARKYRGQVLLVQGDTHVFLIDRPLSGTVDPREYLRRARGPGSPEIEYQYDYGNFTRLTVFGWPDVRAVKITVEPDTPWLFSFAPLYPDPIQTN